MLVKLTQSCACTQIACVTGGNDGIGFITVRALWRKGAKVYLACRSEEKARSAIERLTKEHPGRDDKLVFLPFDLTQLASAKKAGETLQQSESRLDIVVCNAGVMAWPYELVNGVEVQFWNHLGHFALVQAVLPLLKKTAQAPGATSVRVVSVSSLGASSSRRCAHTQGPHRLSCTARSPPDEPQARLQQPRERQPPDELHLAAIRPEQACAFLFLLGPSNVSAADSDTLPTGQHPLCCRASGASAGREHPGASSRSALAVLALIADSLCRAGQHAPPWQHQHVAHARARRQLRLLRRESPRLLSRFLGAAPDAASYRSQKIVKATTSRFLMTPDDGAKTQIYLAASPEVDEKDYRCVSLSPPPLVRSSLVSLTRDALCRGKYFIPIATPATPTAYAQDKELAEQLWRLSEDLVKQLST